MLHAETIRGTLCEVLGSGVACIARSNETARAFARSASRIPEHVLIRHLIEHVYRIRLFRPLDARATRSLLERNPNTGAVWARYARSEAVHDRYFLRDLEAIGLERSVVEATLPFPSTAALVRFVDGAVRVYGPLPVILYSFWAEENSDVGSARIVERVRRVFGPQAARGALAHRRLDENLDHPGVIAAVLTATIRSSDDLCVAAELLKIITGFIAEYFADLDAWRHHPVCPEWPRLAAGRTAVRI